MSELHDLKEHGRFPPWSALVVDDDPGVRQSLRLCLEAANARVLGVGTAAGALEAVERGRFDLVFVDLWLGAESGLAVLKEILSRQPGVGVVVITAFASFETAVEAVRLGAADYLPKPFTPEQVRHAARRVLEAGMLRQQITELRQQLEESKPERFFQTASPSFRGLLQVAARAARSDCVVLLRGESGTGKNVLAEWIRSESPRASAPFVTVNCPMLSNELVSSTLFGHRQGAFAGALGDADGKVQEAEGGTLLLDEVAALSLDAQGRLLRFLSDRCYERLGDPAERRADVRILASTNRHLEHEVEAGRFREDLLFRLNVVSLTLPPLRERPEDILPLAQHYLRFFSLRRGRELRLLAPEAERAIAAYDWPGNLRELRNAVERATILAGGTVIGRSDLGIPVPPSDEPGAPPLGLGATRRRRLARAARARTHRAGGRACSVVRGCGANSRHRRDDPAAQAEALWACLTRLRHVSRVSVSDLGSCSPARCSSS